MKENLDFWQKKLKPIPSNILDNILKPIIEEETLKIDCTSCGNCCKAMQPALDQINAKNAANQLSISENQFYAKYGEYDPINKVHFIKSNPCAFLRENRCSIYSNRPESCRDFPHLSKPHFKYRIRKIVANAAICPIIENTLTRLNTIV